MTPTTTIPYAKLALSPANVRKSNAAGSLPALAASIAEHGLIQPLIVTAVGPKRSKFEVHAGGRRWRAIGLLIEQGKLPKDYGVEAKVVENADAAAREISLAENLQREAMTPADECTAYRDIIADGADAENVARRFGVTIRHVHGRLRLADLAEPIFAALSAGEITLDTAMAYGSTSDQARQLAAWERCANTWSHDNPQAIRRIIAEEGIAADNPIALFVGETEYTAAGGRIERDLFASEGEGTWLDAELARELAERKMQFEAEVAALATRLGWIKPVLATRVPWEETQGFRPFYPRREDPSPEAQTRIDAVRERMNEIEGELDERDIEDPADELNTEYDALSQEYDQLTDTPLVIADEDRPSIGTFLLIGPDGQARLCDQYYTSAKGKAAPDGGKADHGQHGSADNNPAPASPTEVLPRPLEEQLAKDRRDVLALHVAHDPALALDLAIFQLARGSAGHFGYSDTGCTVQIGQRNDPGGLTGIPQSHAQNQLEAMRSVLPNDWAEIDDSYASFAAFRNLDQAHKADWLAFAVSQSLAASLGTGQYRNAFQTRLGASLGIETQQHWRPGAERFFDRLKKSQILGVLGEIDPAMPGRYAMAKKGELASAATKLCAGETIVEPAVKEAALAWLPEQMAFATTVDPDGAEADGECVGADGEAGDDLVDGASPDEDLRDNSGPHTDHDSGAGHPVTSCADEAAEPIAYAA